MDKLFAAFGLVLVLASCHTTPVQDLQDKNSEWESRYSQLQAQAGQLERELQSLQSGASSLTQTRDELTRDRDSLLAKTGQLELRIATLQASLKVNEGLVSQLQQQLLQSAEDLATLTSLKNGSRSQSEAALALALQQSEALKAEVAQLKQDRDRLSQMLAEETQRVSTAAAQLRKALQVEIEKGNLEVVQFQNILMVNINDNLLFAPDSPLLRNEYKAILKTVADAFRQFPEKVVRVEGHTAVAPSRWSSSWDLGAARAVSVVQHLQQEEGIDPTRLVALSFGQYRPLAPNTTAEGRAENRRVQLVLVERPLYQVQELINSRNP